MNGEFYVIDTNIFILLFNDRLAESLPDGAHLCSVITELELLSFPSLTLAEETLIREQLAMLTICDIDQVVKDEAIRLRRSRQMRLPDAVIAATAIVRDATLVTNDTSLQKTPGLVCRSLAIRE